MKNICTVNLSFWVGLLTSLVMIRDFKRLSFQRTVMIKWYDEYKLVSFNLLNHTSMNVFGELLYTRQTGLAVTISLSVIVCQFVLLPQIISFMGTGIISVSFLLHPRLFNTVPGKWWLLREWKTEWIYYRLSNLLWNTRRMCFSFKLT